MGLEVGDARFRCGAVGVQVVRRKRSLDRPHHLLAKGSLRHLLLEGQCDHSDVHAESRWHRLAAHELREEGQLARPQRLRQERRDHRRIRLALQLDRSGCVAPPVGVAGLHGEECIWQLAREDRLGEHDGVVLVDQPHHLRLAPAVAAVHRLDERRPRAAALGGWLAQRGGCTAVEVVLEQGDGGAVTVGADEFGVVEVLDHIPERG